MPGPIESATPQGIPEGIANEMAERETRRAASDAKLDEVISGALDKAEKQDEFSDFVASREHLKELAERHGTDAAGVVAKYHRYNNELKQYGEIGAEAIASDYYANTNVAKLAHVTKKANAELTPPPAPAKEENVFPGVKLNQIIDNAIDETDAQASDRAEFAKAQENFAALKTENPNLTWKEFFENTVKVDRALWNDPQFAYRLAAASGVPVTPLQVEVAKLQGEQAQQINSLETALAEMESRGELDLKRHGDTMAQVLKRPDFVRSNDPIADARRAYRISELLEIEHLRGLANQTAVEKAKRAAPVKSSGGVRAPNEKSIISGGLDSVINGAIARMGIGDD